MENTANNVLSKVDVTNGQERSNRKSGKEEKSKRKDDKSIDQVMKALNNLETTDEKLAAMCKKYAEVMDENRKLQLTAKQFEKGLTVIQREKEQLQTDHSKAVLTRSRLESLCRELQRQNKAVKEESLLKVREEEEKRKEVSAKFNATLSEITSLMSSSNEKTNKLRDENVDITKKFRSICEQSGLQQQQVDKMNMQRKLEAELSEAKMTKQKLEFTAEKEIMLRDKQQLLMDLQEARTRINDMTTNESTLRSQIALYSDRYEEFQNALSRSNEVFGGFKGEMDKMSKKIVKLEKETVSWKTRWEKSHQALLEMATDKQQRDAELALVQRQLGQLQKLCRTLQTERTGLLAQIKGGDPSSEADKLADLAQVSGTSDVSELAALLSAPVFSKLPDISDIFKDPAKDLAAKPSANQAGEPKVPKGSSPKSNKKAKGAAVVNTAKEPKKEAELPVKIEEVKTTSKGKPEKVETKPNVEEIAAVKTVEPLPMKVETQTVVETIKPAISSPTISTNNKTPVNVDVAIGSTKEQLPSAVNVTPLGTVPVEPVKDSVAASLKAQESKKETVKSVADAKAPKQAQKSNKKGKPNTDTKPKEEIKAVKLVTAEKTPISEGKPDVCKNETQKEPIHTKVEEVTVLPTVQKVIPALSQLASKEASLIKDDVKALLLEKAVVEVAKPVESVPAPVVSSVESISATNSKSASTPIKANEKVPQAKEKPEVLTKPAKKGPTPPKEKSQPKNSGSQAKLVENVSVNVNEIATSKVTETTPKQVDPTADVTKDKVEARIVDAVVKPADAVPIKAKDLPATKASKSPAKQTETVPPVAKAQPVPNVVEVPVKSTETVPTAAKEQPVPKGAKAPAKPKETVPKTAKEQPAPKVIEVLAKVPESIPPTANAKPGPKVTEAAAKPTESVPSTANKNPVPKVIEATTKPTVPVPPTANAKPVPKVTEAKPTVPVSKVTEVPSKPTVPVPPPANAKPVPKVAETPAKPTVPAPKVSEAPAKPAVPAPKVAEAPAKPAVPAPKVAEAPAKPAVPAPKVSETPAKPTVTPSTIANDKPAAQKNEVTAKQTATSSTVAAGNATPQPVQPAAKPVETAAPLPAESSKPDEKSAKKDEAGSASASPAAKPEKVLSPEAKKGKEGAKKRKK